MIISLVEFWQNLQHYHKIEKLHFIFNLSSFPLLNCRITRYTKNFIYRSHCFTDTNLDIRTKFLLVFKFHTITAHKICYLQYVYIKEPSPKSILQPSILSYVLVPRLTCWYWKYSPKVYFTFLHGIKTSLYSAKHLQHCL